MIVSSAYLIEEGVPNYSLGHLFHNWDGLHSRDDRETVVDEERYGARRIDKIGAQQGEQRFIRLRLAGAVFRVLLRRFEVYGRRQEGERASSYKPDSQAPEQIAMADVPSRLDSRVVVPDESDAYRAHWEAELNPQARLGHGEAL